MRINWKRLHWSLTVALVAFVVLASTVVAQRIPTNQFTRVTTRYLTVTLTSIFTGNVTMGDDLTVADNMAANDTIIADFETTTPQTSLLLTMNGWITPTGSIQPIRSAGAVSINSTRIAPGFTGQKLTLINFGANTVTITETAPHLMSGNAALGVGDNITLVYSGTAWIETAKVNN